MNFTDTEMEVYRLEPGDVLLSEASGSPGEVGKPALWSGEIEDCAFQNTLLRVRARAAEPRYLLHYFRFVALTGGFTTHARGVGIHHLGRARLAGWQIPLPSLSEQRWIVDILEDHLSRLDAAKHGLKTALTRSEALLTAGVWHATHSLDGAETVALQSIAEVRLGRQRSPKNHSGDRMRPYLRAANVDWDKLRLDDVKEMQFTAAEETTYRLEPGDILLTEASGSAAEVGKSAIYSGKPAGVCFQNTLLRVRCHAADPEFVQKFLLAEARAGRFMPEARGVGINHLGRAKLAALAIEVPSPATQASSVAACRDLVDEIDRLRGAVRSQALRSEALRRALLVAAFSGHLTGTCSDLSDAEEMIGA
jgi:type I restriction enzyme S subunit